MHRPDVDELEKRAKELNDKNLEDLVTYVKDLERTLYLSEEITRLRNYLKDMVPDSLPPFLQPKGGWKISTLDEARKEISDEEPK